MTLSAITLISESFPEPPTQDVAVSHALLNAVAAGKIGPLFRLHLARPILAFGMADRTQAGYPEAVRVARAHGYEPIERLAGGRAAVFHEATLAFSWVTPEADSRDGINRRFEFVSAMLGEAFRSLGIDARVGELSGEYCPGRYSINVGGSTKVMGVGQRLIRGAAHVGGVIVINDSDRIRDVLIPVYRALKLDWDPRTVGALAEGSPGLSADDVTEAIHVQLRQRFNVEPGEVPDSVVAAARTLTDSHVPKVA